MCVRFCSLETARKKFLLAGLVLPLTKLATQARGRFLFRRIRKRSATADRVDCALNDSVQRWSADEQFLSAHRDRQKCTEMSDQAENQQQQQPEQKQEKDSSTEQEQASGAEAMDIADTNADSAQATEPSKKKKAAGVKRETRTIGQFYEWDDQEQLLEQLKPTFGDSEFTGLRDRILGLANEYDVTLEDVLELPANVMNQREVEKVRQVAAKYEELRENARVALGNLIASAEVNAKQREAKALKKKLAAERKARREEKASSK